MNPETSEIWRRICAFELDTPGVAKPFSRKLAQEQDWSPSFALRAVEEYRRFLLLGVAAGHPVSPSDAVDQVWHLHLTYTKSYWEGLCKGVLGQPFHHVPSEGRPGEAAKYADWYRQTLESYRQVFGEAPPEDLWPRPVERQTPIGARKKPQHRRVDAGRHWVIRRPRQLLWTAVAGVAVIGLLLVGGCQEQWIEGTPLDMNGKAFLKFYVVLFVGSLIVAGFLRRLLSSAVASRKEITDDPYAWAWLAGGAGRAVMSVLAKLAKLRLIGVRDGDEFFLEKEPEGRLHPFEAGVVKSLKSGRNSIESLAEDAETFGADIEASLIADGLLLTQKRAALAAWSSLMVGLLPIFLGLAKVVVAVSRGRPVSFLVILLCLSGVVLWLFNRKRRPLTGRGRQALRKLSKEFDPLKAQASHDTNESVVAVALFGSSMLAGTVLGTVASLRTFESPPSNGADGGGWFSGCGSTCGGGGSSCGGGGGCGGCGGGD